MSSKPAGEHKMEGRKEDMKPIAFSEQEVELGRSDVQRRAELAEWIVGAGESRGSPRPLSIASGPA